MTGPDPSDEAMAAHIDHSLTRATQAADEELYAALFGHETTDPADPAEPAEPNEDTDLYHRLFGA